MASTRHLGLGVIETRWFDERHHTVRPLFEFLSYALKDRSDAFTYERFVGAVSFREAVRFMMVGRRHRLSLRRRPRRLRQDRGAGRVGPVADLPAQHHRRGQPPAAAPQGRPLRLVQVRRRVQPDRAAAPGEDPRRGDRQPADLGRRLRRGDRLHAELAVRHLPSSTCSSAPTAATRSRGWRRRVERARQDDARACREPVALHRRAGVRRGRYRDIINGETLDRLRDGRWLSSRASARRRSPSSRR